MDVFPQARGHTLVIHKSAPARNLMDIESRPLQALILTVQRVTRAVAAALKPDGIVVTQFNGAPAGQTVYHLHFHIIPRWEGVALGRHAGGAMADPAELSVLARQIAEHVV
jgi:histidine triad (HIT) family protein